MTTLNDGHDLECTSIERIAVVAPTRVLKTKYSLELVQWFKVVRVPDTELTVDLLTEILCKIHEI
jgi:hypothetical protein